VILNEEGIPLPSKETIKPSGRLSKTRSASTQLRSLTMIYAESFRAYFVVDGVGALRTHAGSATVMSSRPDPCTKARRLSVHAAHTLCLFVIETWEARKSKK